LRQYLDTGIIITAFFAVTQGSTLFVPAQYNTIQSALDSAKQGDTVLVSPGTYKEHLLWPSTNGITLLSTHGAGATVLDAAGDTGSLCGIHTGVDSTTLIRGFAFKNAKLENV
jgi:pectin methylesterase-like acyl-CoA thioesterase